MEQQDKDTARQSGSQEVRESADQLELAARQLRTASKHCRDGETPRG